MLALLEASDATHNLPVAVKTLAASGAAASFRILLMPVDACKTIMQASAAFLCLVGLGRVGEVWCGGAPPPPAACIFMMPVDVAKATTCS